MTEQSSCKSFFKEYLLYRIKTQRTNLILCCIINVLALPLFFAAQIKGFSDKFSDFYNVGRFFSLICGVILMAIAVFGAVFSFDYFHKKNLTDTVGSLPLTYKQRFFGDLLSGYIANVAPVIPCGLISVAVFASAQGKFKDLFEGVAFSAFQLALCMAFSFILALTFVYLFAVLVVSACGKVLHGVLFSVFGTAALVGTVVGLAGCFAIGMIGANKAEFMGRTAEFLPPLGPLMDLFYGILFFTGVDFKTYSGKVIVESELGEIFTAAHVLYIVYFIIFGVGITVGAFYLGKRRKPEKTGSAFVIMPAYYVISALMSMAAAFIMIVTDNSGSGYISGIVAGAVVCLVSIVIYHPNFKKMPRCILCGAAAVAVSIGAAALMKETRGFGTAYLPEDPGKIEYLKINDSYTITDKTDIKKYVETHNDILRENRYNLRYGDSYMLEYKTAGGMVTKLGYDNTAINRHPITDMIDNEKALANYGRYFFEGLENKDVELWCNIVEKGVAYSIPENTTEEFIDTLRKEAEEKYDPDAEVYARVNISYNYFSITKNYEKTIALMKSVRDSAEIDPNEEMITLDYNSDNQISDGRRLEIRIRNKDMGNELVKELIGLFEMYGDNDGADEDKNFRLFYRSIYGSASYYVPQKNTKRVLQIMTELSLKELEGYI